MFLCIPRWLSAIPYLFFIISCAFCISKATEAKDAPKSHTNESHIYIWPLPAEFTFGNKVLSVNPGLSLAAAGYRRSRFVRAAFDRYRKIIFKNIVGHSTGYRRNLREVVFDINKVKITVSSNSYKLQLGVDESYTLLVSEAVGQSSHGNVTIEANTIFGAVRALETFSQLCSFDYTSKAVKIHNAPWSIRDKPRFAYRGLLLGEPEV
ncbi:hypothetical protein QN277_000984 [Acacia crassicarpa]|uniref:Beta-hexosaminidase eukaryotic type N-terminal domain-containing protein n=1 Tax=Acacia crassicarpa TaxID=499986 RepID=A0AAE1N7F8_9FABA|nr:hypothetical protein QN277_000984 [Acacia crassicarpa]